MSNLLDDRFIHVLHSLHNLANKQHSLVNVMLCDSIFRLSKYHNYHLSLHNHRGNSLYQAAIIFRVIVFACPWGFRGPPSSSRTRLMSPQRSRPKSIWDTSSSIENLGVYIHVYIYIYIYIHTHTYTWIAWSDILYYDIIYHDIYYKHTYAYVYIYIYI